MKKLLFILIVCCISTNGISQSNLEEAIDVELLRMANSKTNKLKVKINYVKKEGWLLSNNETRTYSFENDSVYKVKGTELNTGYVIIRNGEFFQYSKKWQKQIDLGTFNDSVDAYNTYFDSVYYVKNDAGKKISSWEKLKSGEIIEWKLQSGDTANLFRKYDPLNEDYPYYKLKYELEIEHNVKEGYRLYKLVSNSPVIQNIYFILIKSYYKYDDYKRLTNIKIMEYDEDESEPTRVVTADFIYK